MACQWSEHCRSQSVSTYGLQLKLQPDADDVLICVSIRPTYHDVCAAFVPQTPQSVNSSAAHSLSYICAAGTMLRRLQLHCGGRQHMLCAAAAHQPALPFFVEPLTATPCVVTPPTCAGDT